MFITTDDFFSTDLSSTLANLIDYKTNYCISGYNTYTKKTIEGKVFYEFELPGFSAKDVKLSYDKRDGYLSISAANEELKRTKGYEVFVDSYQYKVKDLKAKMKNGLLIVEVPEKEPKKYDFKIEE